MCFYIICYSNAIKYIKSLKSHFTDFYGYIHIPVFMHKGCINIKNYTCRGWDVLPDTEGCTHHNRHDCQRITLYYTGIYYTGISSVKPCYIVACPGVQVIPALYGFYMPLYTVYKEIPHKGSINGSKGHIQAYKCIVNSV